jgi:hypothetical protein
MSRIAELESFADEPELPVGESGVEVTGCVSVAVLVSASDARLLAAGVPPLPGPGAHADNRAREARLKSRKINIVLLLCEHKLFTCFALVRRFVFMGDLPHVEVSIHPWVRRGKFFSSPYLSLIQVRPGFYDLVELVVTGVLANKRCELCPDKSLYAFCMI